MGAALSAAARSVYSIWRRIGEAMFEEFEKATGIKVNSSLFVG